ncbi:dihydroorotase [Bacillus lacus]|uniref:Dihydroorotase n=1 Tax=Metabacillus lacus TaxID=1983721 RepID=A0A7X2J1D8_9BACI|nr:dihydroorotase [Metabacillus lacus]MRX73332.1 dihydroorotase [Metabacillus lacus]
MLYVLKNGMSFGENGKLVPMEYKIQNGIISEAAEKVDAADAKVIDLQNKLVAPGLIDLHVHLREPGGEHKETIESGTKAAAKGGFTTIAAMPNTKPVPDNADQMKWLNKRINEKGSVRVLPYAAITSRQAGKEMTDFAGLLKEGAFAFTDDGVGIQSAGMMLQAMKSAAEHGAAIVAHCEDNTLINRGSVHEGKFSEKHGLNGIPSVCESVHIARDVLLAEAAGCHYHVCHISTKESVRAVRDAKAAGIHVTAEVTPHHLLLSEEDIPDTNPNFKMNPPLRGLDDQMALLEGLLDGTIDFIATDHAPHTQEEKNQGMQLAPFGITGLETAFPLLYTNLVLKNKLELHTLLSLLTTKPAEAFQLPYGKLEAGSPADMTIIDLELEKEIDPGEFLSKGKNTPFAGWTCKGWPVLTFAEGKIVWEERGTVQ